MGAGGPPHHLLHRIRADYPLSIHGVGFRSAARPRSIATHLKRLKRLIDIYQPALFSEHLAWSSHDGVFLNDLLPLPYNEVSLAHVCDQSARCRTPSDMRMLLENPSTYVVFGSSTMTEIEFLACGRATHRLRSAARRQQRPCFRGQPRLRRGGLYRRVSDAARRRISPCWLRRGPRQQRRASVDRRPRLSGRRCRVGPLPPGVRAPSSRRP